MTQTLYHVSVGVTQISMDWDIRDSSLIRLSDEPQEPRSGVSSPRYEVRDMASG